MSNYFIYEGNAILNFQNILISKDNIFFYTLKNNFLDTIDKEKVNLNKYKSLTNYYFKQSEIDSLNKLDTEFFINFAYKNIFFFYNKNNGQIILYADRFRYMFSSTGTLIGSRNISDEHSFFKKFIVDYDDKNLSSDFIFKDIVKSLKKNISRDLNSNELLFLEESINSEIVDNFYKNNLDRINKLRTINTNEKKLPVSKSRDAEIGDEIGFLPATTKKNYSFNKFFIISKDSVINLLDISSIDFLSTDSKTGVYFNFKHTDKKSWIGDVSKSDFKEIYEYYMDILISDNDKSSF